MAPRRIPSSKSPIASVIARNLRAARGEMSQTELGRMASIDPQQISKWERGVHRPTDESLAALAQALDREITWFYVDHDEEALAA